MVPRLEDFRELWCIDFEYQSLPGEPPVPICMVAHGLRNGRTYRIWLYDADYSGSLPFPLGENDLYISFYAIAEISCHLALGWPLPANVLDLFTEFRVMTNGHRLACGNSLVGALVHLGLDPVDVAEKDSMRDLAIRGGPYTAEERAELLRYCESDVMALVRLLPAMETHLDLPRALLRGWYMSAAACMEHAGVPLDVEALALLQSSWNSIKDGLIQEVNRHFGVFEGQTFRQHLFAAFLERQGISWPRHPTGRLALDEQTFRSMARAHPALHPLRELRATLSKMRLASLTVGWDGRNRCMFSAFRSITGRNQPSNTRFIFGPAVWMRGLIRPEPGMGLVYIDWRQQEIGIAAALSGDPAMQAAYRSGDFYMTFAIQAGAAPEGATKATHPAERALYKECALAVNYLMGAVSLGLRIGRPPVWARELLQIHRQTYQVFWRWSDAVVDHAMLYNSLETVFGWPLHLVAVTKESTLRNFPMQANAAEMLRLAVCMAIRDGVRVLAPVHDALIVEAPLGELDEAVRVTQRAMAMASEIVLDGFRLQTDVEKFRYPARFTDPRGEQMWNTVWQLIHKTRAGS